MLEAPVSLGFGTAVVEGVRAPKVETGRFLLLDSELPPQLWKSLGGGAASPWGSVWLAVCGALRQDVSLWLYCSTDPRASWCPTKFEQRPPTGLIWLWVYHEAVSAQTSCWGAALALGAGKSLMVYWMLG